jgi:hypothetical protein
MLSRRDVVGKLAAGTAVVCAAGVAGARLAPAGPEPGMPMGPGPHQGPAAAEGPTGPTVDDSLPKVTDSGPPATLEAPQPWELLHPLAMGSAVAHGWRVAGLRGVTDGSCVLTLQNERGRSHRVHLCRNDGGPQGLVYTKHFDLVVMNGGEGDLPTEESFGQAVAEVAHVLAANEGDRRNQPIVTALLPQAERVRLFAGSADRRLR